MICDFLQIQGGQQISYFIRNLRASLNLLEKPKFTKGDDVHSRHLHGARCDRRQQLTVVLKPLEPYCTVNLGSLIPAKRVDLLS